MEKNKVILEIMDLYDENQRLKSTILWLENQLGIDASEEQETQKEPTHYEYICNAIKEESEKQLLKEVVSTWRKCWCKFNEETQEYEFQSYERWLKDKINDYKSIFEKITIQDFTNYFSEKLTELYEEEKKEALEKAMEEREEQEND